MLSYLATLSTDQVTRRYVRSFIRNQRSVSPRTEGTLVQACSPIDNLCTDTIHTHSATHTHKPPHPERHPRRETHGERHTDREKGERGGETDKCGRLL